MNNSGNESMCNLFMGEPLVESGESLRECPHCGRDFSKYSMMRKECHLEACMNALKEHNSQKLEKMKNKTPKKYVQTTLDCAVLGISSSQNDKNVSRKNPKTPTQKSSMYFLNKAKSEISSSKKKYQSCLCPYSKDHIKERIAGLFTSSENINKKNIDFSNEPFLSTKRLLHYEILSRDFQKLTKRCPGDVTIKAKNGTLRWHKIILQMRTRLNVNDTIDLSDFEKESLLAYEKYIYGGEIRYSHHLLKDLKTLSEMYGPESLENYLKNEFTINEENDINENYEVKRYNNALELDGINVAETTNKPYITDKNIPLDSFNETMDYQIFDAELNKQVSIKCDNKEIDNKSSSEKDIIKENDVSNEIVNETIEFDTSENINILKQTDIQEDNLIIQPQNCDGSYDEVSPNQTNNTFSDFENSNFGVIVFEDDEDDNDEVKSKIATPQSKLENISEKQDDILDYNINSPGQSYFDESFYGIIEGGYYSNDSRCVTPVTNIKEPIISKEKSSISNREEKLSIDLNINKSKTEIYKTPNINKTTNDNHFKIDGKIKSKKQMIEEQLTKSSQLVKYTDVTPRPTYEQMSEVELNKELAKYGIGKCGKKKAIMTLDKIYNQLHPKIVFEDINESPKGRKRKARSNTKLFSSDSYDNILSIHDEDETNNSINSSLSSQDEINILEESCIQFQNSQGINDSTEDISILTKGKKPKEVSEWRSLFVNFIRLPENKVTLNRILSYSTFELSEIYQLVKSSTHSIKFISKSMLITILDELHISFTLPSDGWDSKAKKRKK
ncbi:BTB/POZ fold domain-containing protein [Strongyloides ratti]|uniref:BTB/POZ fold domain-containing protein n=1 Tax=Strongyloides ratti TaxID=34506 RepID=A0A090LDB3_STRRB|nr:BTB/POZ fold domain-containing protein [Strongyloides ratti]CEF67766.1 BTB/POZ fold domain-containing protein [Strongyloides ratti]